jgi:glyoxylase-like metal-dependent hydrolase (beta-lactamase superfamily II)
MLEKVTDRIYYYMHNDDTDRPALGLVRGEDGCLIIDAGNSPKHAKEFKKEIELMDFPEVRYLVVTHHHWDHTFGLNEWNIVTIANQSTSDYMKTYGMLKYDDISLEGAKQNKIFNDYSIKSIKEEIEYRDFFKPMNSKLNFSGELKIDLGGLTCILRKIVSPHTDDSTIVYVPEEKMLFLGDCCYGYTSHGFNYYDKNLTLQMIDTIEQYDVEYYLCSHETICTREEMESYFKQLRMGAAITESCNNFDEAIIKYKKNYGAEPSDEDLFFIKSFGAGEGWGREMDLKRETF